MDEPPDDWEQDRLTESIRSFEPTPEEVELALGKYRDSQFATLLVVAIQLAAKNHPEELRKALSQVFDLRVVEEQMKRILSTVAHVQQKVSDARALASRLELEIKALEKRRDLLADAVIFIAETNGNKKGRAT